MSRTPATSTDTESRSACPPELDPLRLPAHVAVIMDGNGRWAEARGLPRVMGHRAGVEALKSTLRLCNDWGIEALTAYAFSTENWARPGEEVNFLMTLFERVLQKELQSLEAEQVRIRFLGDLEDLPQKLQDLIGNAMERTAANNGIHFNVCTNYGGRRELVRAAQRLATRAAAGELDPQSIDENSLAAELFTRGEQDPERTMTLLEECIATGETRRRVYAGSARNPLKTSATEGGRKGV